jgi:hypothetical protein
MISMPMAKRDIDEIIEGVRRKLPNVKVSQYRPLLPADDDGIWWFSLPDVAKNVHVESPYGNCPFVIETEEQSSGDALRASSATDAVNLIVQYLKAASEGRSVLLSGERNWN